MPPRWFVIFISLCSLSVRAAEKPSVRAELSKNPPPILDAPKTAPSSHLGKSIGNLSTQAISLDQALSMALSNNLEIQFNRVGVFVEDARRQYASGVFDPVFTSSASRESTQRPDNTADITDASSLLQVIQVQAIEQNTRAIQIATGQPVTPFSDTSFFGRTVIFDLDVDRYQSSLQFRTPLGTQIALTASQSKIRSTFAGDTREIDPYNIAFGGFEIRQPLLKNFGPAANLSDVRIARVNKRVAEIAWRNRVSDTMQAVMSAYYEMQFGMDDIRVKEDAVAADQALVDQNQRRMDLGFMSPIDVQQARVAVSEDEEKLLTARGFFLERQYQLKRLISKEYQVDDARVFIPIAAPRLPMPTNDRTVSMRTAYENRLDYKSAIAESEVQDIRLRFAKNQLWPTLDLIGSYGYNGLSDTYHGARTETYRSQAPQWSAGVQFSIPLGNVQPRAQLKAIQGVKEQALLKIKQVELTVSVDVDTILSRIETNRQRVETARQSRQLGDEAVRIANRRLDEGQISSFDVIETRRKSYDARSRELASEAELQKSITQYWLVTGTVLENAGVVFK